MNIQELNREYDKLIGKNNSILLQSESKDKIVFSHNLIYLDPSATTIQYLDSEKYLNKIILNMELDKNLGEFEVYIPDIKSNADLLLCSSKHGCLHFFKNESFTSLGWRYIELLKSSSHECQELSNLGFKNLFCAPNSLKIGIKFLPKNKLREKVEILIKYISIWTEKEGEIYPKYKLI